MRAPDEKDYAAIHEIQEFRNCTPDHARRIYKDYLLKLADPDIENRAETIVENVKRGMKPVAEKKVDNVDIPGIPVAKKKKGKAPKKAAAPRPEVAIAAPTKEVKMTPVGEEFPYVHRVVLSGNEYSVIEASIDHGNGAKDRFGFVGVSEKRLKVAKEHAKNSGYPVAIAVTVRVKGKLDQGYLIPLKTFEEFKLASKNAVTLSAKAREAYKTDGFEGLKFVAGKAPAEVAA